MHALVVVIVLRPLQQLRNRMMKKIGSIRRTVIVTVFVQTTVKLAWTVMTLSLTSIMNCCWNRIAPICQYDGIAAIRVTIHKDGRVVYNLHHCHSQQLHQQQQHPLDNFPMEKLSQCRDDYLWHERKNLKGDDINIVDLIGVTTNTIPFLLVADRYSVRWKCTAFNFDLQPSGKNGTKTPRIKYFSYVSCFLYDWWKSISQRESHDDRN